MKKIYRAFLYLLIIGIQNQAEAQTRIWTKTDGRTVEAEIVTATKTDLTIKLKDNREFQIKITDLIKADQVYVSQWLAQTPAQPKARHSMTFWTFTADDPYSGTDRLGLALEINGQQNLRHKLPTRNFARNGVEEFADIPVRIHPDQINEIKMLVLAGDDLWKVKKVAFQFRSGELVSDKIDFYVNRPFSMDEREGSRERNFSFDEKIKLKKAESQANWGKAEIVKPSSIKNPQPGRGNRGLTEHYLAESDESRGVLEMKFAHEHFGSNLKKLKSIVLVLQISTEKFADTKSTIAVWNGRKILSTRKGATRGETVKMQLDPRDFEGKRTISLDVKCGDNAVIIEKGSRGPHLEVIF